MALNRIQYFLTQQGRTKTWLAWRTGEKLSTISRNCANKSQPTVDRLMKISYSLGVSMEDLMVKACAICDKSLTIGDKYYQYMAEFFCSLEHKDTFIENLTGMNNVNDLDVIIKTNKNDKTDPMYD